MRKLGIIIAITCLTILGIELLARFLLWQPYNPWERYRNEQQETTSVLGVVDTAFSPEGLGDLVPHQDGIWTFRQEMPYHVKTNEQGLRNDEDINMSDEVFRILAVGDSFTFGPFVNNPETWSAWLQTTLNRQFYPDAEYQVLNAGFPGYTITDVTAYLKDKGLDTQPQLVILDVTPNDVRDFSPEKRALFERPKIKSSDEGSADNKSIVDVSREVLENNSALFQLTRNIRFQLEIGQTETSLSDNELANGDIDDDNAPTDKTEERQQLYEQYLPTYEEHFVEFVALLKDNDIPLLVVYFPTVDQLPDDSSSIQQDNLTRITTEHDVPFLDLLPFYRQAGDDLSLYLYTYDTELGYVGDGHPSRYGHYVSAQAIAETLIELKLITQ